MYVKIWLKPYYWVINNRHLCDAKLAWCLGHLALSMQCHHLWSHYLLIFRNWVCRPLRRPLVGIRQWWPNITWRSQQTIMLTESWHMDFTILISISGKIFEKVLTWVIVLRLKRCRLKQWSCYFNLFILNDDNKMSYKYHLDYLHKENEEGKGEN